MLDRKLEGGELVLQELGLGDHLVCRHGSGASVSQREA